MKDESPGAGFPAPQHQNEGWVTDSARISDTPYSQAIRRADDAIHERDKRIRELEAERDRTWNEAIEAAQQAVVEVSCEMDPPSSCNEKPETGALRFAYNRLAKLRRGQKEAQSQQAWSLIVDSVNDMQK